MSLFGMMRPEDLLPIGVGPDGLLFVGTRACVGHSWPPTYTFKGVQFKFRANEALTREMMAIDLLGHASYQQIN